MILAWILLAIFVGADGLNAQLRTCFLDNGEPGQCVIEKECSSSDSGSICGYFANEVAVCCPKSTVSPNTNLARKQRSPGNTTKKQIRQDTSCKFDNGDLGKCLKEEDCPSSESGNICGYFGNSVAVCCPVQNSQKIPKDQESSNLRRKVRAVGDISKKRCKDLLYKKIKPEDIIYVYNGRLAHAKEFKHMAVLGYGKEDFPEWKCGGALISEQHVLTAAHCVLREKPSIVRLGDLDVSTSTDDASPRDYKIKRISIFDGYKPPAKYHDIAIVELDRRVIRSDYIDLACLDSQRRHNDSAYYVMGWGKTEFAGDSSSQLMTAEVVPYQVRECKKHYGSEKNWFPQGIIDDYMICAGGQSDTCNGDSGGPLVVINKDLTDFRRTIYTIVGVTSFGKACGISGAPGVYTRVQNYLPWIERIIWSKSG